MTVHFITDGSVTDPGFMAIWEAVDNDGMGTTGSPDSTTTTTTTTTPSTTATTLTGKEVI